MKIYVVLNSHLDPIWLWRRSQGIDEVINSARTACNLLDRYPEIFITRGEAWFYEIVEKCDPALFKRIRNFIDAGRWEVVGGWYVQPDCNMPTPSIFRKHCEIGARYFREHLGVTVKTGYNVDSFGHAATLPDFYTEAGIGQYVMMRPRDYEKTLPARNFLWESPNGNQLQVFRLWNEYTFNASMERMIWQVPRHYDENLGITMALIGFGDHGGGPLVPEIEWLRTHLNYSEDIQLEFSTTERYFDAVRALKQPLPVVRDELQYHAIGCYSVVGKIKREVKSAASLLEQADGCQKRNPELFEPGDAAIRENGWKKILFASFHDVLSGSAVRSSYGQVYDDLGFARSAAENQLELAIRRENRKLPDFPVQRLIFDNFSDRPWKGIFECEPWVGWERWNKKYQVALTTLEGKEIPLQRLPSEAAMEDILRIAFPLEIPANGRTVLAFPFRKSEAESGSVGMRGKNSISNQITTVRTTRRGLASLVCRGKEFLGAALKLEAVRDSTDTWGHGVNKLDEAVLHRFELDPNGWFTEFEGNLMTRLSATFAAPEGTVRCSVTLKDGELEAEIFLRIHWFAEAELLRLSVKPGFKAVSRRDGIPGGAISRPLSKQEFPIQDFTSVTGENGETLVVASRELNSVSVRPDGTIQLTLLRSPLYAWDEDHKIIPRNGYPYTDQGETEITLKLAGFEQYDEEAVRDLVGRLETDSIHFSETTKGFQNPYQLKAQDDPNFRENFRKWADRVGEKI